MSFEENVSEHREFARMVVIAEVVAEGIVQGLRDAYTNLRVKIPRLDITVVELRMSLDPFAEY